MDLGNVGCVRVTDRTGLASFQYRALMLDLLYFPVIFCSFSYVYVTKKTLEIYNRTNFVLFSSSRRNSGERHERITTASRFWRGTSTPVFRALCYYHSLQTVHVCLKCVDMEGHFIEDHWNIFICISPTFRCTLVKLDSTNFLRMQ